MFQIIFEAMQVEKTVSEVSKTWYFPNSAFWSADQWGATAPHSGYATAQGDKKGAQNRVPLFPLFAKIDLIRLTRFDWQPFVRDNKKECPCKKNKAIVRGHIRKE